MTVVDFIILIFLVFFLIQGLLRGFIKETFSIMALSLGLIAAINFHQHAGQKLIELVGVAAVADSIGFALVYLTVWLAIKFMGWSLGRHYGESRTNPLSSLSGGLLGLIKGLLIASLIVFSAEANFPENKITGPNLTTPTLLKIASWSHENNPFLPDNRGG